jgi:hypothetical protein
MNHFNNILESYRSARWSLSKKAVLQPKFPFHVFPIAPCARHNHLRLSQTTASSCYIGFPNTSSRGIPQLLKPSPIAAFLVLSSSITSLNNATTSSSVDVLHAPCSYQLATEEHVEVLKMTVCVSVSWRAHRKINMFQAISFM